jgi:hypothetical protein
MSITWKEPPATVRRKAQFAEEANEFRLNPMNWGVLATYPNSQRKSAHQFAYNIRTGKKLAFREGVWETTVRQGELFTEVFVRYVGEGS